MDIKLTKDEKTIVTAYITAGQMLGSQQDKITAKCEQGKQGQQSIIKMAQYLKVNNESINTLKMQVSRGMKKVGVKLSLQGIGESDKLTDITIAPTKPRIGGAKKSKENTDTVKIANADTVVKAMNTADLFDHFENHFKALESVEEMDAYINTLKADRDSIVKQRLKVS